MNNRLQIRVDDNGEPVYCHKFVGPAELGRQSEGEEGPYCAKMASGRRRIIIARREEQAISRRYVLVEPAADGKVRLTNLRSTLPLHAPNGGEMDHLASHEVPLPTSLVLSHVTVRIEEVEPDEEASIPGLSRGHGGAASGLAVSLPPPADARRPRPR